MRLPEFLSHDELGALVQGLQAELYLDKTDDGWLIWNPEKDWAAANTLQRMAEVMERFGLTPEEHIEVRY